MSGSQKIFVGENGERYRIASPCVGRRTGVDRIGGKKIRVDEHGNDNVDDYFSDSNDGSHESPSFNAKVSAALAIVRLEEAQRANKATEAAKQSGENGLQWELQRQQRTVSPELPRTQSPLGNVPVAMDTDDRRKSRQSLEPRALAFTKSPGRGVERSSSPASSTTSSRSHHDTAAMKRSRLSVMPQPVEETNSRNDSASSTTHKDQRIDSPTEDPSPEGTDLDLGQSATSRQPVNKSIEGRGKEPSAVAIEPVEVATSNGQGPNILPVDNASIQSLNTTTKHKSSVWKTYYDCDDDEMEMDFHIVADKHPVTTVASNKSMATTAKRDNKDVKKTNASTSKRDVPPKSVTAATSSKTNSNVASIPTPSKDTSCYDMSSESDSENDFAHVSKSSHKTAAAVAKQLVKSSDAIGRGNGHRRGDERQTRDQQKSGSRSGSSSDDVRKAAGKNLVTKVTTSKAPVAVPTDSKKADKSKTNSVKSTSSKPSTEQASNAKSSTAAAKSKDATPERQAVLDNSADTDIDVMRSGAVRRHTRRLASDDSMDSDNNRPPVVAKKPRRLIDDDSSPDSDATTSKAAAAAVPAGKTSDKQNGKKKTAESVVSVESVAEVNDKPSKKTAEKTTVAKKSGAKAAEVAATSKTGKGKDAEESKKPDATGKKDKAPVSAAAGKVNAKKVKDKGETVAMTTPVVENSVERVEASLSDGEGLDVSLTLVSQLHGASVASSHARKASRSSRASGVGLPPSSSKASRLSAEKQSLTSAEKKKRKSSMFATPNVLRRLSTIPRTGMNNFEDGDTPESARITPRPPPSKKPSSSKQPRHSSSDSDQGQGHAAASKVTKKSKKRDRKADNVVDKENVTNQPYWLTMKDSTKILRREESDGEDGLRRSSRTRVRPLAHYKGERILYGQRVLSGDYEIGGIIAPNDELVAAKNHPRKHKTTSSKPRKKTGALSDRYLSVHVTNYEEPEVDSELQEGLVVQYDENTQKEQPIKCFIKSEDAVFVDPMGDANDEGGPLSICRLQKHGNVETGEMIIRPLCSKDRQNVHHSTILYHVIYGKVEVVIHNTTLVFSTNDRFDVLPGNSYSIRNLRTDEARLGYTIIRRTVAT